MLQPLYFGKLKVLEPVDPDDTLPHCLGERGADLSAIPFNTVNILEFVVDIIHAFSPRALLTERRIGPGCMERPTNNRE